MHHRTRRRRRPAWRPASSWSRSCERCMPRPDQRSPRRQPSVRQQPRDCRPLPCLCRRRRPQPSRWPQSSRQPARCCSSRAQKSSLRPRSTEPLARRKPQWNCLPRLPSRNADPPPGKPATEARAHCGPPPVGRGLERRKEPRKARCRAGWNSEKSCDTS